MRGSDVERVRGRGVCRRLWASRVLRWWWVRCLRGLRRLWDRMSWRSLLTVGLRDTRRVEVEALGTCWVLVLRCVLCVLCACCVRCATSAVPVPSVVTVLV